MKMQGAARRFAAREWLLPFGDGGFAAGTAAGILARSYHGLLVAAPDGESERRLFAACLEEVGKVEGATIPLTTHHHEPDVLHPEGHACIVGFRDTIAGPRWTLDVAGILIERAVTAVAGGVRISWRILDGDRPLALVVRPFLSDRAYHGGQDAVTGSLSVASPGRAVWTSTGGREVALATSGDIRGETARRDRLLHVTEAERGLACREDLVSPCAVDLVAGPGELAWLEITLPSRPAPRPPDLAVRPRDGSVVASLRRAVAAFFVRDHGTGRPGVLAGYPWFNEWGRDTMIAASGLAEAIGWDAVLDILDAWAARVSRGMIPNRLAESESSDLYNSVDASLWMLIAVERAAAAASRPRDVLARFHDVAREIVDAYREGTRHGIRLDDEDGLLEAGEGSTQLTWMDAKVGDRPITPRHGKCVEINALYHAGLGLVERMERAAGHTADAEGLAVIRRRLATSMTRAFAPEGRPWIRDILDDEHDGLRPNVLIALAAPRCPFPARSALATLAWVRRELMTPCGPRTLAPTDPRYRGRCRGGVLERDEAYHQGTVWPWLVGPWVDAELAYRGRGVVPELRREVAAILSRVFSRTIAGHVPEIFDGDAPHHPRGAPAQAWSAAELLRVSTSL